MTEKAAQEGANWEFISNFADCSAAIRAAEQANLLIEFADEFSFVRSSDYSPPGQEGIEFYQVGAWSAKKYPNNPHTIRNDSEVCEIVPDLLQIFYSATRKLHVNDRFVFQILRYLPNGHTRKHRDRYADDTVAVNLDGSATCALVDPVSKEQITLSLTPGDALYFVNPIPQKWRPLHKVTNTGDDIRTSLVV